MSKHIGKSAMKMAGILADSTKGNTQQTIADSINKLPQVEFENDVFQSAIVPGYSGGTFSIAIALIDNSPYQPRLEIDPETLDELAESMKTLGRVDQPIRIRKVGERYQLIAGHRRKMAAKNLGWTKIDCELVDMTDREAELSTLINNLGSEDLSDFEKALLYQRALDNGFAQTQKNLAELFATSQATVSSSLAMLTLPKAIIAEFHRYPRAISRSTAKDIATLLENHPNCLELILRALGRITTENAPQSSLKTWVQQRIASANRQSTQDKNMRLVAVGGKEMFRLIHNEKTKTIELKMGKEVESSEILEFLTQVLNEKVSKNK